MFDYPLITTDSHFPLPPTLADRLPDRYRNEVTHLERRGSETFLVRPAPFLSRQMAAGRSSGNRVTDALAGGVPVDPDDERQMARLLQGNCCLEASPGFTVESRREEMARDGVVGEIVITNFFGGPSDPDGDRLWCEIQNDWTAATFAGHLDTFAPTIVLPLTDPTNAAAELRRAAGLGLRPGLLPYHVAGRPFSHPDWEPLWAAAEQVGVPLAFHVNGRGEYNGAGPAPIDLPGTHLTMLHYLFAATTETLGSLVNSGVFERHPGLRVVMVETAAGWLPWFMESADFFHDNRYSDGSPISLRAQMGIDQLDLAPPSYYVRRNVKCTFMYDPVAIRSRHDIGLGCLLWGNDYPHAEGLFPHSREVNHRQFAGVPPREIAAIVHDTAADLLGLEV
ncbi:MAG TPA: amidohydrolase family protein [Acidimicrobiales bacterium]|nr:amidohydrolase family protein [Acidimicrobiales bacterium]